VLNILLNFDLLPTAVLACTGAVCRLRTSQMRKADIIDVNDKIVETIRMENGDMKKFKNDLKAFVSPKKNRDEHQVKYVDIYWPIPFLRVSNNIICHRHKEIQTQAIKCFWEDKGFPRSSQINFIPRV